MAPGVFIGSIAARTPHLHTMEPSVDFVAAFGGGKHLKACAQEVVGPDRAGRTRYLIAQIHAAAKGPAHFELADAPDSNLIKAMACSSRGATVAVNG